MCAEFIRRAARSLIKGRSIPDWAGGGAHAPSEEFAAALNPGLNPLSVPAAMRSSARWCPSLRSWEAAVVNLHGGDGFVLRIHEQESVAATEVMEPPRHERTGVPVLPRGRLLVKSSCRIRSLNLCNNRTRTEPNTAEGQLPSITQIGLI